MPSRSPERLRWSGPVLTGAGLIVLAASVLRPGAQASPLAWWIANSALRPDRLLPLIGLGVALGVAQPRARMAGALAFAAGLALGFAFYETLLAPLWAVPKAPENAFLTGPAAALAAGAALIASGRIRGLVLPPLALVVGIAAALAVVVTDPSLRDPGNRIAGVLIALWLPACVALTVAAFGRPWFEIAARILGSWLVAIALLYAAAASLPEKMPSNRSSLPQMPDVHEELQPALRVASHSRAEK